MKILNYIALIITIIGAVNWGLIGVADYNLVEMLFGTMSMITRVIYVLVGVSGIYLLTFFPKISRD